MLANMSPGIRPGETPPFHKLGEYDFQDLCRDLLVLEPTVATCEIYGVRGQSQNGIDLLAHRRGNNGIEVGQCKCYLNFSVPKIRGVSEEFFNNWDHWSKQSVKRFILFVACELNRRELQDEILEQKKRFESRDLEYEVWSAVMIRNKLRPQRGIVATYCFPAEHWVRVICGEIPSSSPADVRQGTQTPVVVPTLLLNQLDELSSRVAGDADRRIELMRSAWREGRKNQVAKELQEFKDDKTVWQLLPREIKAKMLRFEASWVLEMANDIPKVKRLADEAKTLDPSQNQARLRALITWRENGSEAALSCLEGQDDIDSLNLKAALLLQLGRTQGAIAVLNFEGESDGGTKA